MKNYLRCFLSAVARRRLMAIEIELADARREIAALEMQLSDSVDREVRYRRGSGSWRPKHTDDRRGVATLSAGHGVTKNGE